MKKSEVKKYYPSPGMIMEEQTRLRLKQAQEIQDTKHTPIFRAKNYGWKE